MKNKMKMSIIGIAAAGFAIASQAAVGAECQRLVVTGHPSYAPVSWAAGDSLQGGGIALARRLAEDAGVPVTIINAGSWDAAQQAVASGKADLIVGIYKTAAREKIFDYVKPEIAKDPSAVLVKAGGKLDYRSWDSLVGKKGLISDGESYGPKFDDFAKARLTIEKVAGFPAVFDKLQAGTADYGLMGYYPALTSAPKDKVSIAVESFATEPMYIAFGKTSPCRGLARAFGKGVKASTRDGTVERLWKIGLIDYAKTGGR